MNDEIQSQELHSEAVQCATCGQVHPSTSAHPVAVVVDGTITNETVEEVEPSTLNGRSDGGAEVPESTQRALVLSMSSQTRSILSRVPQAAAIAWQQPAVRTVVKTGTSAVALSLLTKLAGRWLASRGARGAVASTAAPSLGDWLRSGELAPRARNQSSVTHVSETFIYIHRVERW